MQALTARSRSAGDDDPYSPLVHGKRAKPIGQVDPFSHRSHDIDGWKARFERWLASGRSLAGNPAGMDSRESLARKLCVPTFRWVCPYTTDPSLDSRAPSN